MKVTREQAALNRERIVEVAAKLFRERGYDGIGVADLMKGAGLTHGGFYGHFGSNEDLLAEARGKAVQTLVERWRGLVAKAPRRALAAITGNYLSAAHATTPAAVAPSGARPSPITRR
jgi:TetR/AcrR family transcriptional repressor of nem operon